MTTPKELLEKKLQLLKDSKKAMEANMNAQDGAIQVVSQLLAEMEIQEAEAACEPAANSTAETTDAAAESTTAAAPSE